MHWEPEESPAPEQWEEFKLIVKEHPAQWMIWEGTPKPSIVDELKKSGLDSLTFDPCGNVPEAGNYLSVMHDNVQNLEQAFNPKSKDSTFHNQLDLNQIRYKNHIWFLYAFFPDHHLLITINSLHDIKYLQGKVGLQDKWHVFWKV